MLMGRPRSASGLTRRQPAVWLGQRPGAGVTSADLDGVLVFNPQGKVIGLIRLPWRCKNLTFGSVKNGLFMASCHSIYAFYVEAEGAV
jgi:gluconolactonase